jgi:hypothetical protein
MVRMTENYVYVKATLKTHEQLVKVYPEAEQWGKPIDHNRLFPSADEVILPYLGRTVWVQKKRLDLCRFFFRIKGTEWVVLPEWIESFDAPELVSPAKWNDPYCEVSDDTWLEPYEDRWMIIENMLIITG